MAISTATVMIEGFSYPAALVPPEGSYERKVITRLLQHVYRYGYAHFTWTAEKSGPVTEWLHRMVRHGPQHVLILVPNATNEWILVRGGEGVPDFNIDRFRDGATEPSVRPGPPPVKGG